MQSTSPINIQELAEISKQAGQAIMDIYRSTDFQINYKDDHSPLTKADKMAHQIISTSLLKKYPTIPLISEEGIQYDYSTRKNWTQYWLVDPLDGTKEFIKRNGEFTVNIALIRKNIPVLGVIHIPVQNTTYIGSEKGAFKQIDDSLFSPIHAAAERRTERVAVQSKSHASSDENMILKKFGVKKILQVGSSLKFCLLAEGKADIYYRQNPTMEWDTAAGQAISTAAGASVFRGKTTIHPFRYNKEKLVNGDFLCIANVYLD